MSRTFENWFFKIKPFGILCVLVCLLLLQPLDAFAKAPNADPQSIYPVETLEIKTKAGSFTFTVEIADEPHERSRGLMFRETMLPTHGMLFDFGQSSVVTMWMQNTPLSLDMVFIREDGTVARITTNTTPLSRDIITSGEAVSHVLELNAGMARQIGLSPGDKINHNFFTKQQKEF